MLGSRLAAGLAGVSVDSAAGLVAVPPSVCRPEAGGGLDQVHAGGTIRNHACIHSPTLQLFPLLPPPHLSPPSTPIPTFLSLAHTVCPLPFPPSPARFPLTHLPQHVSGHESPVLLLLPLLYRPPLQVVPHPLLPSLLHCPFPSLRPCCCWLSLAQGRAGVGGEGWREGVERGNGVRKMEVGDKGLGW
ncbi:unnamed protein product [Closterium sp. NIES-54]